VWDSKSALREDCRPAKLGSVRSTTETCCAQRSLPIRGEFLTSTAERQAAVEFAKAAAMRPRIVGEVLNKVAADPGVEAAMFEILEIQKIIESKPALPSFLTRADYSLYYWPPRGSKKHSHSRRVCDPKPQLPNFPPNIAGIKSAAPIQRAIGESTSTDVRGVVNRPTTTIAKAGRMSPRDRIACHNQRPAEKETLFTVPDDHAG
jgi:hypothetical protein